MPISNKIYYLDKNPSRKLSSPQKAINKLIGNIRQGMKEFTDVTVKHKHLYRKWKNADMLAAILAILGLVISIIEYEIGFEYYYDEREALDNFRN